mgnify:CR=1 FL=1
MVAQMDFSGAGLHRQRWITQKVMRAMHTSLGWRFLVLLDCHSV